MRLAAAKRGFGKAAKEICFNNRFLKISLRHFFLYRLTFLLVTLVQLVESGKTSG